MHTKIVVEAFWDEEAKVWVAESRDVPGLCTEAANVELLLKKLDVMIPELLEANGIHVEGTDGIPYELLSRITAIAHRC